MRLAEMTEEPLEYERDVNVQWHRFLLTGLVDSTQYCCIAQEYVRTS